MTNHHVVAGLRPPVLLALPGQPLMEGQVLGADALTEPGNSGAPLIDVRGQVLGVNTCVDARAEGIGFAVPAETVRNVAGELIAHGKVERGALGVAVAVAVRETYVDGRPTSAVVVMRAAPRTASALRAGDAILTFDGVPVRDRSDHYVLLTRARVCRRACTATAGTSRLTSRSRGSARPEHWRSDGSDRLRVPRARGDRAVEVPCAEEEAAAQGACEGPTGHGRPRAPGRRVEHAAHLALTALNTAAQGTVSADAVGRELHGAMDPASLPPPDLEGIDRLVRPLRKRYVGLASAEGAAAGLLPAMTGVGVVAAQSGALVADVTFLLGLSLRAVGEHLTCYGLDMHRQEERLYALQVVGLALGPDATSKTALLNSLAQISRAVAQRQTWKQLEEKAFVKVAVKVAARLGVRLTQRKLGRLVPIAGGAVGAAMNGAFVNQVCGAAYMLGRERFLLAKDDQPPGPVLTPRRLRLRPRPLLWRRGWKPC